MLALVILLIFLIVACTGIFSILYLKNGKLNWLVLALKLVLVGLLVVVLSVGMNLEKQKCEKNGGKWTAKEERKFSPALKMYKTQNAYYCE